MTYMLCRNRIPDFDKWREVFKSHRTAHEAAGLRLAHVWRKVDEPDNVYFVFAIESIARAQAFIDDPASAAAGAAAGVIDGEYHFVDDASLY